MVCLQLKAVSKECRWNNWKHCESNQQVEQLSYKHRDEQSTSNIHEPESRLVNRQYHKIVIDSKGWCCWWCFQIMDKRKELKVSQCFQGIQDVQGPAHALHDPCTYQRVTRRETSPLTLTPEQLNSVARLNHWMVACSLAPFSPGEKIIKHSKNLQSRFSINFFSDLFSAELNVIVTEPWKERQVVRTNGAKTSKGKVMPGRSRFKASSFERSEGINKRKEYYTEKSC